MYRIKNPHIQFNRVIIGYAGLRFRLTEKTEAFFDILEKRNLYD